MISTLQTYTGVVGRVLLGVYFLIPGISKITNFQGNADYMQEHGMIFIPFCFNEAPANMLTNPALDPYGKIPELKFSAARLETVVEAAAE